MVASHNTVRMQFDVDSADYLHLHKRDASFPQHHFAMLADEERCQVGGAARRAGGGAARGAPVVTSICLQVDVAQVLIVSIIPAAR